MGSGKSAVGRTIAALLRLPFLDTDHMVEMALGRSISQIFSQDGEEVFRRAETLALQRLLVLPDCVVATGGGAVTRPENWEYMLASGLVVRLKVSPEESLRRTQDGTARPLLAGPNRLGRLRELQSGREPWYARAERWVESDGRSVQNVAQEIIVLYEEWRNHP